MNKIYKIYKAKKIILKVTCLKEKWKFLDKI